MTLDPDIRLKAKGQQGWTQIDREYKLALLCEYLQDSGDE